MYQRLASDWICSSLYLSGPRAICGNVIQTWIYLVTNGVVNGSCFGWCWNIDPGMACSYTLWEGSRGQNVVVLFAFCKDLIRDNTVLRQKSNPQKIHFFVWQQKAMPIEINWMDLTMSALFGPVFAVWRAYIEVNFGQDNFRYVQIHRFFRKKCWFSLCIWRFLCYFGDI